MSKHVATLLTAVGLPEDKVQSIMGLADDAEFDPTEVVKEIHTGVETKVKNDASFWESLDENNVNETFKKKIEAQQYGRASNIVRQKVLKGLGMTEADFADLSEDERKQIETFIPKAIEKYATSKASDKQLQADLLEERRKLEELQNSIPEKETALTAKLQEKADGRILSYAVLAELSTVEGLTVPPAYLLDKVVADLKSQYHFEIGDTTVAPKQKDKPNLDVTEGTKILTLKDLLVKKLTADGLIAAGGEDPLKGKFKKVDVDPDDDGTLKVSSHILEKIKAEQG